MVKRIFVGLLKKEGSSNIQLHLTIKTETDRKNGQKIYNDLVPIIAHFSFTFFWLYNSNNEYE